MSEDNSAKIPREGNEVVENETIRLDGADLRKKSFIGCNLIYGGGVPPTLIGCDFMRCNFLLDGAAKRTASFFNAFAKQGDSGRTLVLSMIGIA